MDMVIFGFGSLLNVDSLRATVPSAFSIRPSYIKGFVRDFSVWDAVGFHDLELGVIGDPYCAVDVKKITDTNSRVNGITFKLDTIHFQELLKREHDYNLITTEAYDFETNKQIGVCSLFSSNKNDGSYDFDSIAQESYLQVCLSGARQHGVAFYQEFLDTTFINGTRLSDVSAFIQPTLDLVDSNDA
jgi:hypothetical protein